MLSDRGSTPLASTKINLCILHLNSKTHPKRGGFCCVCVGELTLMMGVKWGAFEQGELKIILFAVVL